jgi:hypothetical protein
VQAHANVLFSVDSIDFGLAEMGTGGLTTVALEDHRSPALGVHDSASGRQKWLN